MSKIRSSNIEPSTATTLTLGASGDSALVSSDSIKNNTWQDIGGNNLFVSNGSGTVSNVNGALAGGGFTQISSTSHSSVSTSEIGGMDSTYDEYWYVFQNIHLDTNDDAFRFQSSADMVTFGQNSVSVAVHAYNYENSANTGIATDSSANWNLANNTGPQWLGEGLSNSAASALCGILKIYNPASTVYATQYTINTVLRRQNPSERQQFVGGYINVTAVVQGLKFSCTSGTFDGVIELYGVS